MADDVGEDGLLDVLLDEGGGALLFVAPDLAHQHDGVRAGILFKKGQQVHGPLPTMGSPPMPTQVDWPMPALGQGMHDFIGQGAAAGDDADATRLVDGAGHDADLALRRAR
jgi:hypothetical protein